MTYLMPAEWEKHEGTWLAWPHNQSHWPGKFEPIPLIFAEIVRTLAESEKVFICVNDQKMEDSAREILTKASLEKTVAPNDNPTNTAAKSANTNLMANVFFHQIPTDSSWARDIGPIFVRDLETNKLIITDWVFNAWGNKYKPYNQDNVVPQIIGEMFSIPVIEPGIVLEGGSIDVNGKGTLLTTEQCLLNKNRNPNLNRTAIEGYLKKYLGVTNVLWLKEGIIGDDTDGHIDDIGRFVNPTTVVCALEENPQDENYKILQTCFQDLQKMKDQDGNPLKVIALPMPNPVIHEGQRLPASYANFYIANKVVIVPTFKCPQDEKALSILKNLFPDRKIIGIDCTDLIWGLGTFHCSTQQQPIA
ncbi:MAG: agmatine deiminase family protein [Candidatus Gracilibacteria bacterium]|jgi:agmatine deiminase